MRVRRFIEADLAYTGLQIVSVIGHSMGVTLARKAIKGGTAFDPFSGGFYDVGPSLKDQVDTFIGIAGANWGITSCYMAPGIPCCSQVVGFYPGNAQGPVLLSQFLWDLNTAGGKEGNNVYAIYSPQDEVMGFGGLVWGRYTSSFPTVDAEIVLPQYAWTHLAQRDYVGPAVYQLLTNHTAYDAQRIIANYIRKDFNNTITTYQIINYFAIHTEFRPTIFEDVYNTA